jgi:microcystin-dependent protein
VTTRSGSGTISFVDAAPGATIGHSNSIGGGSGGVVGGGAYSSDAGTIYTSGYFETSSYYQTTWENPIAISTLSKYLSSIPANDSKKIVSLLEDNARSLEDHLDTAYLKTSGGTVYGPTTLAGDINLIGTVSVETRPLISLLPPPGSITLFGGTSLPGGWLPCDGTAVSRTDYATLWSVIGGNFGAGNGSTTFNLPNLASKFPLGSTGTPGATGGSATIATGNLPTHTHGHNHTHDFDISQADAHNHFYTISSAYQAGTNRNGLSGIATATRVGTSVIENANLSGVKPTRGADGDETDNGGFANSAYYPPYVTVRYIIKT